jgi:ABC-type Fe3+-hydroxamate transport system substrate-binding protein
MLPKRILSLVPSQTELLFDLGLDEEVVGLTKFCIHPADNVKNKTVVGGTKTLHIDRIHALRPDLIIANKEENERSQIEELQRRYTVHVTDMVTFTDALTMIREVGNLVGKSPEAEQMAQQIEASLSLPSSYPSSRPSVAYFIWQKPYMVAANSTFIHSMLELAGFRNAFAEWARYPEITVEDLQSARPDLIFLSSEPYPFTDKHVAEFQKIYPSARALVVDGELFSWYGSRLLRSSDYFRNLRNEIARSDS